MATLGWTIPGAATTTTAAIVARLDAAGSARIALSLSSDLSSPVYTASASSGDNHVCKFSPTGLTPATTYHYAVEVDGVIVSSKPGRFVTAPSGPASFTFGTGSCTDTSAYTETTRKVSNLPAWDLLRARQYPFSVQTGDLNYQNINVDDAALFRAAWNEQFTGVLSPRQAQMWRQTPLVYTWDDHDYGADLSNKTTASRPAARAVYRETFPHYPLPLAGDGVGGGPIHHSFTWGRVRFVLLDSRSEADTQATTDSASKYRIAPASEAWLCGEIDAAEAAGHIVALMTAVPWIASDNIDTWWSYSHQRARIANHVVDAGMAGRIFSFAGDMHGLAMDSGASNTYATGGAPTWPHFQAAALNRPGSVRGGPFDVTTPGGAWDDGTLAANGADAQGWMPNPTSPSHWMQYGHVAVTDAGGETIAVTFQGKRINPTTTEANMFTYTHEFTVPAVSYLRLDFGYGGPNRVRFRIPA